MSVEAEFLSHLPGIFKSVEKKVTDQYGSDIGNHVAKLLEYNIPMEYNYRGTITLQAYKILVAGNGQQSTVENLKLASILGWIVEFLQSSFAIVDDIMDKSLTRRRQPCWYLKEGIGMSAINDAAFIRETVVHILLQDHFGDIPAYPEILKSINETCFVCVIGQMMDLSEISFDWESYKRIAYHKAASCTYYLDVKLAMLLAGINDPGYLQEAKDVLVEIGFLFQVQNDYFDCYGETINAEKIGTDIEAGKCTWFIVKFMELAEGEAEKQIMLANYGREDKEAVQCVKDLYAAKNLHGCYLEWKEKCIARIRTLIKTVKSVPEEVFEMVLEKLIRRELQ